MHGGAEASGVPRGDRRGNFKHGDRINPHPRRLGVDPAL
jgi:hypothetical protein